MRDGMMNIRDIRPEDIGPILKVVGTEREPTPADFRNFVVAMGPFETREDPWKTKTPSFDELKDMNIEEFRRFLAAPGTDEERESRLKDTAELLGHTPGELMLLLAGMPLVLEPSIISVITK